MDDTVHHVGPCMFCWIHAFLFYKGKGKEDGVGEEGVRVNVQVNGYVIISPSRRGILFFGVEVSLEGEKRVKPVTVRKS